MIISIEGNIGTGKSTLLHDLQYVIDPLKVILFKEPIDKWFKIKNLKEETILTKFYEDPSKYSFSFQIMVLKTLYEVMMQIIKNNPNCEVIICERCILSSNHVFTKMLYDENLMNEIEYKLYQDIYNMWCSDEIIPNKIIYLQASPIECFNRIHKRNRVGENYIQLNYLQKCEKYYNEFIDLYKDRINIVKIDVEIDFEKNTDHLSYEKYREDILLTILGATK